MTGDVKDQYDHVTFTVGELLQFTEVKVTKLEGPGVENGNDQELYYEVQSGTSVDQVNKNPIVKDFVEFTPDRAVSYTPLTLPTNR